ncbi:2822_t:CDS:1, partial [Funneliformis geosporum]
MTKTDLQKELLERIKPGTKPSDIKKGVKKSNKTNDLPPSIVEKDQGYESDGSNKSNNPISTPPLPPTNLLALQKQIELHKEIKKADERIKE